MELKELVAKNRSYRRFYEEPISEETLKELVALARITPSAANAQALKYRLVYTKEENEKYFKRFDGLVRFLWTGMDQRSESVQVPILLFYVIRFGKNKMTDDGIAAQTILLGAVEKGLGGCMLGNVKREELAEALESTGTVAIDLYWHWESQRKRWC